MVFFIELRHVCSNGDECDEGMLCAIDTNSTKYGNRNQNQPQVCLCNGDDGFTEDVEDNNCNGKPCATEPLYLLVVLRVLLLLQLKADNHESFIF